MHGVIHVYGVMYRMAHQVLLEPLSTVVRCLASLKVLHPPPCTLNPTTYTLNPTGVPRS